MVKIVNEVPPGSNLWIFLVIEGDAGSNTFEVVEYTDNREFAERCLKEYPDANVYALVKTTTIVQRTIVD